MKRLANFSPNQLAFLTLFGGILSGSIFIVPGLSFRHNLFVEISLTLALAVAGFWLMWNANQELKQGIEGERWPSEQIEKLRSIIDSPFVTALIFFLFIAFAVLSLPSHHPTARAIGWTIFMPSQALSQLRMACRRPQKPTQPIDWHAFPPIQSEHWGNR